MKHFRLAFASINVIKFSTFVTTKWLSLRILIFFNDTWKPSMWISQIAGRGHKCTYYIFVMTARCVAVRWWYAEYKIIENMQNATIIKMIARFLRKQIALWRCALHNQDANIGLVILCAGSTRLRVHAKRYRWWFRASSLIYMSSEKKPLRAGWKLRAIVIHFAFNPPSGFCCGVCVCERLCCICDWHLHIHEHDARTWVSAIEDRQSFTRIATHIGGERAHMQPPPRERQTQ